MTSSTYDGVSTLFNPMEFHNITSHDVRLGVRWMLDEPEPCPIRRVIRKG